MSPKAAQTPTTPTSWKKKSSTLEPVEVPSGNMAIIRRKPLTVFLKAGLIPNDLLPIVNEALASGKSEIKPEEIMQDPAKIRGVLDLIDVLVVEGVAEPKVYPVPLKEEERDEDKLYVDEVDWEDKQFIYMYVLGRVTDVEQFRKEQAGDVVSLSTVEDVAGTPVKAGGDRG